MFELPNAVNVPLIMVGPGTGVVPFIGFIEQRLELLAQQQDEEEVEDLLSKLGATKLYFGCRRPTTDYIFKDILNKGLKNGAISELNVAFSRGSEVEGCDGGNQYVQDILRTHKEELITLITKKSAVFFICGNTKMGLDV